MVERINKIINWEEVIQAANNKKPDLQPTKENPYPLIDITNLYSQDEIKNILKEVGAYNEMVYPVRYSVELIKDRLLVINNMNCTNDTTEFYINGKVINSGSWHQKELHPADGNSAYVDDAMNRLNNAEKIAK